MEKKTKVKKTGTASKAKKGTQLKCDVCGMVLTVAEPCGCDTCDITCCDQSMEVISVGGCCG
jgi:hypothetical protein